MYTLTCLVCIYGEIGDKVHPKIVRGKANKANRGVILTVNEHDTHITMVWGDNKVQMGDLK